MLGKWDLLHISSSTILYHSIYLGPYLTTWRLPHLEQRRFNLRAIYKVVRFRIDEWQQQWIHMTHDPPWWIHWRTIKGGLSWIILWLKQCHKSPIWEWFITNGDGLLLFYPHYTQFHKPQSGMAKSAFDLPHYMRISSLQKIISTDPDQTLKTFRPSFSSPTFCGCCPSKTLTTLACVGRDNQYPKYLTYPVKYHTALGWSKWVLYPVLSKEPFISGNSSIFKWLFYGKWMSPARPLSPATVVELPEGQAPTHQLPTTPCSPPGEVENPSENHWKPIGEPSDNGKGLENQCWNYDFIPKQRTWVQEDSPHMTHVGDP